MTVATTLGYLFTWLSSYPGPFLVPSQVLRSTEQLGILSVLLYPGSPVKTGYRYLKNRGTEMT